MIPTGTIRGMAARGIASLEDDREQSALNTSLDPASMTLNPNSAFNGRTGATDLLGKLSRAQWDDYKARFLPLLNQVIGLATDTTAPESAANRAMQATSDRFDGVEKTLQMNDERYGLQLSPEEMAQRQRKVRMAEAGSAVDAANKARQGTRDRQLEIMSGSQAAQLSNIDEGLV